MVAAVFAPVTEELSRRCGRAHPHLPPVATSSRGPAGARMAGPKRFGNWLGASSPTSQVLRIGSLARGLRGSRKGSGRDFRGRTSHWDLAARSLHELAAR
jgi:hypothetical protein